MNWFTRLFAREKVTQVIPFAMGYPKHMQFNPDSISKEAYKKLIVAYRCVNLISSSVAGVKYNLFKNGDQEIENHKVLDLLKRPNPMQSYMDFATYAIAYYALHGNSFIEGMASDVGRPPSFLVSHRTSRFSIKPGQNMIPSAYQFKIGHGKERIFPVDQMGRSQILHMKTFNPLDDWWGQSPIESAAPEVDTLNSANQWNLSLLQNSARPSGAFIYEGDGVLNDEKRRRLRKDLDTLWAGTINAGKPLLLGGKLNYKEFGFTPKDMDFINSKKVSKSDLALAFGVPGQLVGVEGSQTFANFEQAKLAFYLDTVLPITRLWLMALNMWLLPSFGLDDSYQLMPDEDSIPALEPVRKMQWDKAQLADWLTPNEKRELTGYGKYEPTDDPADQLYIQASEIPIDFEDSSFEQVDPDIDNDDESDNDEDEEGKAFNLRSRSGKTRFWRSQNRKRDAFIRKMRREINALFKMEAKEVISAIQNSQSQDMMEILIRETIQDNSKAFEPILSSNIQKAMKTFGSGVIGSLQPKKDANDKLDFAIRQFIEREVGNKITKLSGATRRRVLKRVKEAVTQAEIEGLGIPEASKAIEKSYSEFTKNRSLVIARTEIHNAAMEGSKKAAEATGIPNLKKEWISSKDTRVRDMHRSMDGQRVELNEKFQVPSNDGIDMMDGPGDISAPADQVINCRCVLGYSN